ncbi:hypothetical protein V0288_24245 [Pannus brasiliensis CCIBt3594]|uniref:PEP-CTERM sorting domain-containing protein n=1 Tax=Pannus brasiliensis CCIBt3594 TaxID=1427578 RepID=A0AAW9QXP7_9CHRO
MFPQSPTTLLSTLLGAGVVLGLGTPVLAVTVSYNTIHNFSFNVGGNLTPLVRGYDGGSAFAFSPFASPTTQFTSYGLHNYTISPPVPSLPYTHTHSTTASRGFASATATSFTQINSIGIGTVSGTISASGQATAKERGEVACANSFTGVTARQRIRLPFGIVVWGPRFNWDFVGGAKCGVRVDPISFSVTDPNTGEVLSSGKLFDITNTGDGRVNWGDQSLDFAISEGTFSITLDSPFIRADQRGSLFLEVQKGIITRSEDSGIFENWLPGIGSSGTFSISSAAGTGFTPDLNFDYDLGDFGRDVDVELSADGGVLPVPEPSTVSPLSVGVLGLIFLGWKRFRGRCFDK